MASNKERALYDEAQQKLVSSMLASDVDISEILESVRSDDVDEPALKLVFDAVSELFLSGEKVSVVSVAEYLDSNGQLAESGGLPRLYELHKAGEEAIEDATPKVYARLTKEFSAKKTVLATLKDSVANFKPDSGFLAADAMSALQADLNDIMYTLSDEKTISTSQDLAAEFHDRMEVNAQIAEENAERADGVMGIPTPLPTLSRETSGWMPSQMITIAANTGVGKSVFAINSLVAGCQSGKSVLFFSLEMERHEIENRIVSSVSGIQGNDLKVGKIDDPKALSDALSEIDKWKFQIDTRAGIDLPMIRAQALKKAATPEGLDLIILDYLQLVESHRKSNNRQVEVAEISRAIKKLAKDLMIPVIAVAQLTRPSTPEDAERLPTRNDIRESGAIANDSDIIVLLHRERNTEGIPEPTKVILDKNRNGPEGRIIMCHSDLKYFVFREMERSAPDRITDEDLDELDKEAGDILGDSDLDGEDFGDQSEDFDSSNEELDF